MADLPAGNFPLLSPSTLRHLATLWSQAEERVLILVGFIALAVLAVVFIGLGFGICWVIFVLPLRRKAAAAEQAARAQPPQRQPWEPPVHGQVPEQGKPAETETEAGAGEEAEAETEAPAGDESSDAVGAGIESGTPGELLAMRFRFFVEETEVPSAPQRRVRLVIEREVAEVSADQLSDATDLGDAEQVSREASTDDGFRERLADAAADYFAARAGDPLFATITHRWVTRDSFPETTAAQALSGVGSGLKALAEKPLEQAGAEMRLPEPAASVTAGISAELILEPVTRPLRQVAEICEVFGVVAGLVTGLHPLTMACAKMLAHDGLNRAIAEGITEAAREVGATGPELPGAGEAARLEAEPVEVARLEAPRLEAEREPGIEPEGPADGPELGGLSPW